MRNPFREWIGAQIRTDLYGWVNPGDVLRAAEWAWRDAAVSHTRNGIYGAMYAAALGAYAVVASSIDLVLDAAASVVPPTSRLARAITLGRELADAGTEPTTAYARLEEEFASLHWVHTLNNAALLTYALAAGRGDFDRTICLTVMGGWDTDSCGATAGAVAGALGGPTAIAERWSEPLRDRLSTSIPGLDGLSFDRRADRTLAVYERVRAATHLTGDQGARSLARSEVRRGGEALVARGYRGAARSSTNAGWTCSSGWVRTGRSRRPGQASEMCAVIPRNHSAAATSAASASTLATYALGPACGPGRRRPVSGSRRRRSAGPAAAMRPEHPGAGPARWPGGPRTPARGSARSAGTASSSRGP